MGASEALAALIRRKWWGRVRQQGEGGGNTLKRKIYAENNLKSDLIKCAAGSSGPAADWGVGCAGDWGVGRAAGGKFVI